MWWRGHLLATVIFSVTASAFAAAAAGCATSSKAATANEGAPLLPLKGPAKRTEEETQAPRFTPLAAMNDSVLRAELPPERPALLLFFAAGHESAKAVRTLHILYSQFSFKGLAFSAIAVDRKKSDVEDFVIGTKNFNWRFPIAWDEGRKVSAQYTIPDLPTFYLVDEKGKIAFSRTGFDCDERLLRDQIRKVLKEVDVERDD